VRADDGSFPRRLRVWIYIARPANPSPPSRRYLDAVLKGARHFRLPEEYITKLAATPALE
jgi:AIG2 family protein